MFLSMVAFRWIEKSAHLGLGLGTIPFSSQIGLFSNQTDLLNQNDTLDWTKDSPTQSE